MADDLTELKKLVKDKKIIIGTANTLKGLRSNSIKKLWLSSNVNPPVKEDILHYCKLNKCEVVQLSIPNDEFGVVCKKQFSVSVCSMGEK